MTHLDATELEVCGHLLPGLALLERAYNYAQDFDGSVWEFAVEIDELRALRLTNVDFRWLIRRGYVEYGRDVTKVGDAERQFARGVGLRFDDDTCFVLSENGADFLARVQDSWSTSDTVHLSAGLNGRTKKAGHSDRSAVSPRWDPERHQLRLGEVLVKEFKINSPNQEAILMAFEEEGWPPRINDPLAPQPELDPKERLRNTIKSLNRRQLNRLIRFLGDGTGQAVRWELFGDPNDPA